MPRGVYKRTDEYRRQQSIRMKSIAKTLSTCFKKGNNICSKRKDRQSGYVKKLKYIKKGTKSSGRPKGFKHSEETKQKLRLATIKQLARQRIFCDTNIERMVENYFLFKDILYVKQYATGHGVCDFWLPEINTIVECDGEYWHNKPHVKERDERRDFKLSSEGYEIVRLKGQDIMRNCEGCLKSIQ